MMSYGVTVSSHLLFYYYYLSLCKNECKIQVEIQLERPCV